MCGIAGIMHFNQQPVDAQALQAMLPAIHYRGPDDQGTWLSSSRQIGFAHTRLSIIDLSPNGHQPMCSVSGRFVIVFNGEIYNYQEIKKELVQCGCKFRGNSDTEVMLAAIEEWGLTRSLNRFAGMFAFALWDNEKQELNLVRDRFGIKPLYYSISSDLCLFGSDLKVFKTQENFKKSISPQGFYNYFQYGYCIGAQSIFEGIKRLMPGQQVTVTRDGKYQINAYWSLEQAIEKKGTEFAVHDTDYILQQTESALSRSVKSHLVADVPIGVLLSGGIDSTLVTTLAQQLIPSRLKTFSIGFGEAPYNEAPYASAIAKQLGTEHTELYVDSAQALNVIPLLPEIYSEPFADDSQIPTYLVSKLASEKVKVVLSGDGGDELFAGYHRHLFFHSYWKNIQRLPLFARNLFAKLIFGINTDTWNSIFSLKNKVSGKSALPPLLGEKLYKMASLWKAENMLRAYHSAISQSANVNQHFLLHSNNLTNRFYLEEYVKTVSQEPLLQQLYMDAKVYLVEDVLTKVDRASMINGIEARVPLLDHTLFEHALRIPSALKIQQKNGKYILKKILEKYLPKNLIYRPKQGFSVPIAAWLRGPLREMVETYLDQRKLQRQGYLNSNRVRALWEAHLAKQANHSKIIWSLVVWQMWLEKCHH